MIILAYFFFIILGILKQVLCKTTNTALCAYVKQATGTELYLKLEIIAYDPLNHLRPILPKQMVETIITQRLIMHGKKTPCPCVGTPDDCFGQVYLFILIGTRYSISSS